jgi:hypothetical protein
MSLQLDAKGAYCTIAGCAGSPRLPADSPGSCRLLHGRSMAQASQHQSSLHVYAYLAGRSSFFPRCQCHPHHA